MVEPIPADVTQLLALMKKLNWRRIFETKVTLDLVFIYGVWVSFAFREVNVFVFIVTLFVWCLARLYYNKTSNNKKENNGKTNPSV